MDSVLDNTYKPKPLKTNQFDTNAGYCSINEQDLLNQFINVSAKLSHDTLLAIRQVENIDLVYALIKDTTYMILSLRLIKRWGFQSASHWSPPNPSLRMQNSIKLKMHWPHKFIMGRIVSGVVSVKNKALDFCQMSF